MKRIYALSLTLVLLAGCTPELLTSTATTAKLEAENAKAMDRQLKAASESLAKSNLERAINEYNAENGRFPAKLDDLVPGHFQVVPNHADGTPFAYDPTTGKLLDGPAAPPPPGPTPGDKQKLEQISAAIDKYGRSVGYYPPSLQALVPTYLSAVPKTDSGQDFIFDPQNGYLAHPLQPQPPAPQIAAQPQGGAPRPVAGGGGGAGPMGEAMTGIAMQNQLNSASGSATNAAGSYARQGINGVTDQHNKQQERAMDQLGL